MLKNAPNLAIRGVDTDENEPSKVSMKWGSQTGVAPVMRTARVGACQCNGRAAQTFHLVGHLAALGQPRGVDDASVGVVRHHL